MPITLQATFERLSEALEKAETLPKEKAIKLLHSTVQQTNPEPELLRWFLRRVAQILAAADDGA